MQPALHPPFRQALSPVFATPCRKVGQQKNSRVSSCFYGLLFNLCLYCLSFLFLSISFTRQSCPARLPSHFFHCPSDHCRSRFHQIYCGHQQSPDKNDPSNHAAHKDIDKQDAHRAANVIAFRDNPEKHPMYAKWNTHEPPQVQIIALPILHAQRTEQRRQKQCRYNRDYHFFTNSLIFILSSSLYLHPVYHVWHTETILSPIFPTLFHPLPYRSWFTSAV